MLKIISNNLLLSLVVVSVLLVFNGMCCIEAYGDNLSKLKLSQKFKVDIDPAKLIKVPIVTMHVPFNIKNWPVAWRHGSVNIYSMVVTPGGYAFGYAFGMTEKVDLFKTGDYLGVVDVVLDKGLGALTSSGTLEGLAFAVMEKGDECMFVGIGTTDGFDNMQIGSGIQLPCEQLYTEIPFLEDIKNHLTP